MPIDFFSTTFLHSLFCLYELYVPFPCHSMGCWHRFFSYLFLYSPVIYTFVFFLFFGGWGCFALKYLLPRIKWCVRHKILFPLWKGKAIKSLDENGVNGVCLSNSFMGGEYFLGKSRPHPSFYPLMFPGKLPLITV